MDWLKSCWHNLFSDSSSIKGAWITHALVFTTCISSFQPTFLQHLDQFLFSDQQKLFDAYKSMLDLHHSAAFQYVFRNFHLTPSKNFAILKIQCFIFSTINNFPALVLSSFNFFDAYQLSNWIKDSFHIIKVPQQS